MYKMKKKKECKNSVRYDCAHDEAPCTAVYVTKDYIEEHFDNKIPEHIWISVEKENKSE